jgi:hypothetical protein
MKKIINIIKYLFLMFFYTVNLFLNGCGEKETVEPDPLQEQEAILINQEISWVLNGPNSVYKDGLDVTDQFTGFKLTFAAGTYTTENSLSSAWPASGTWAFHDGNINQLIRDDDTIIKVNIDENTLNLNFNVQDLNSSGRIKSLAGEYSFELVSE